MKNNKGFTLVETIAVIIILGVVLSIAVPSITNVVKSTNKNRMISDAETFISEVKEYVESDTIGNTPSDNKYTLEDIKGKTKLSKSPYGEEYKKNSYVDITNYSVCLTDGEYKATTETEGSIKVEKGNCSNG
ncbi:putative Tfp assembly type protein (PilE-like) [Clostridium sp. CAG:710]|nr:putative Tfp assembly type protein (PilE-like) [Clostridium sp. CAG:710]